MITEEDVIQKGTTVFINKLRRKLISKLRSLNSQNRPSKIFEDVHFYKKYPKGLHCDVIRYAAYRVKILQTWISDANDVCQAFDEALYIQKGQIGSECKIQLLLIDPACDFCELRGIHSGLEADWATTRTTTCLKYFQAYKKKYKLRNSTLEIRLSKELPTFAMFAGDSHVLYVPYYRLKTTYESPCWEFFNKAGPFKELNEHFDKLWEDSSQPCEL